MARVIERTAYLNTARPEPLKGTAFTAEAGADTFVVSELKNSGTVLAHVLRADNIGIAVSGSIDSQGRAVVTLPADCYHVAGRISVAIYVTAADMTTECVYACVGTVHRTVGDTELDSGTEIPSLAQLEAAYENCLSAISSIPHAVLYDAQTLDTAKKAQARENIGAASAADLDAEETARSEGDAETLASAQSYADTQTAQAVKFSAQTIQLTEQGQARANVGAASEGLVNVLHGLVNYGYDTPGSVRARGQGNNADIRITRAGTRMVLNGTANSNQTGVRLYASGNQLISSQSPTHAGITLVAGHRYRLQVIPVSGTLAGEGSNLGVYPARYDEGSADRKDTGYSHVITFTATADPIYVGLFIYRYGTGFELTDYTIELTLEDITDGIRDLPAAPTAQGLYALKCSVNANGVPTYAWVQEGATLMSAAPDTSPDESE